jgi:YfiH family protein
MGLHPNWLIPQWPAPTRVRAVCTTRSGGLSQGPFESFNLGDHVGDRPEHVAGNRAALQVALQARPVFMQQVHATTVLHLGADTPHDKRADAAVARQPGLACVVMVADCLPILLAHQSLPLVAALHAGWRGLAGPEEGSGSGIVEAALAHMAQWSGCSMDSLVPGLMAWLGPCIGPRAFEVGAEVRHAYTAKDPRAADCFTAIGPGKFMADLPALARQRLDRAGVSRCHGNDGSDGWCTVRNSAFFSHRASIGRYGVTGGRMAACIWLV